MDDQRFDALTRLLGSGLSRRQVFSALGAAVVGAISSSGLTSAASCRRHNAVCSKGGHCCSGLCSEPDATGRKRCVCPPGNEVCKGACADPATSYLSDPNNCGACGIKCTRTRCGVAACINGVCGISPDPKRVGVSCTGNEPCVDNYVCQADGSCTGTPKRCRVTESKCQSATCNPATGECETTNFDKGTPCPDSDRCDGEEACDGNGVCAPGTPICAHLDTVCKTGVCDPKTGACSSVNKPDRTSCLVLVGVDQVNGYCCNGLCSQCCGTVDDCPAATEANIDVACIAGLTQCSYTCPWAVPACTNPAVTSSSLICRLEVGSACTEDTECCGFCVNEVCEAGATGSACLDGGDCATGLYCDDQGACAAPLAVGVTCDPENDICVDGSICGREFGHPLQNVCCLEREATTPCTRDHDCCQSHLPATRDVCILGACAAPRVIGACGDDGDCAPGYSCYSGTCQLKSILDGPCERDANCAYYNPPGVQLVCASGVCKLPSGTSVAGTTGYDTSACANGSVQCDYGTVCGNCCTRDALGFDPFFCGDAESEKICCNNTCIYRNNDTHCGRCDLDCTCGGTDPYRYCTTKYDSQTPSWDWPAICSGTYSASSGHCAGDAVIGSSGTTYSYCSTNCPEPEPCDCSQPISSLFCYAGCVGQYDNLTLSTCAEDGETCLNGNDETCCGENSTCTTKTNCSPGTTFCLSEDYVCVGNT